jgi:hypothetical protein
MTKPGKDSVHPPLDLEWDLEPKPSKPGKPSKLGKIDAAERERLLGRLRERGAYIAAAKKRAS